MEGGLDLALEDFKILPSPLRDYFLISNPRHGEAIDSLNGIVFKAISYYPRDRQQTAQELLDALTAWKGRYGHLHFVRRDFADKSFPPGEERDWLLTGWPRDHQDQYLPALPKPLDYLESSTVPHKQAGIETLGASWYRALEHRFSSVLNLIQMSHRAEFHDDLRPLVENDRGRIERLIRLCRNLERFEVKFSDSQQLELHLASQTLAALEGR
jgi:hypothetical protein